MLQISPIFIVGSVGALLLVIAILLIFHYRKRYQDLEIRTDLLASNLKQRETQLTALVDQTNKRESRCTTALVDANKKLAELEMMIDACADPALVRFRINQLGGMLSVLQETTGKPSDIASALADARRMSAQPPAGPAPVPDKGTK